LGRFKAWTLSARRVNKQTKLEKHMPRIHSNLAILTKLALAVIMALGFLTEVQAQDKKADPVGTWTWTRPGRNGGPDQKMTLKLKKEGDKLTGVLTSPGRGGETRDTDIKDAKVKDDELSFSVTREVNGNSFTMKYHGKIAGDTIKGKTESERDGQTQSRDWEAKRAEDKK
jgi:hypothetical protein